jgi:hypothetical protein
MDPSDLLERLERAREAHRWTWRRMTRSDKTIVLALVLVGLANIVVGSLMIWRG